MTKAMPAKIDISAPPRNDTGNQKRLFIRTWGCQMNVYDSRRMSDVLASLGYKEVDTPEGADMVILNTCHIREKATEKVFSELGRLREHKENKEKEDRGQMVIAVAGCVAQAEGEFIMERAPYVDMVFGPQTYHELPEMVAKATNAFGPQRVVNTEFPVNTKFDRLPEEQEDKGPSAFLSIQEGCDKFCTFCVVPYTRGSEYSRPMAEIIDEAKKMRDMGTVELTLLGQNVNAYHGKDENGRTTDLAELIAAVAEVHGIERIRYTTSHPRDMNNALVDAHKHITKLMPYLHLPVQSGSDNILKSMNRKHTADEYREIIADMRKARPDIAVSSDFIVGFPGETDQDFEDTMQLVRDISFSSAYSFKYSPRPGTPGANMQNQIHEKIKSQRLQQLQALLAEQKFEFNKQHVDQVLPVLFDRKNPKTGQMQGKTPYNQTMNLEAPEKIHGKILPVMVKSAHPNSLSGEIA